MKNTCGSFPCHQNDDTVVIDPIVAVDIKPLKERETILDFAVDPVM